MNIALDYDGTFDLDLIFWYTFIQIAATRGHNVCIVSAREPVQMHDIQDAVPPNTKIYATGLIPKRAYMERQGIAIDVWIDDWPEWICGCAA